MIPAPSCREEVISESGLPAPRFLGNSEDFKDKRDLTPKLPATTKESD
jgi:hypothetical protein